jgi:hypothetical protein
MPPVFKKIISISVWILFIKGLLIASVTMYTFGRAYLAGETTPMVGVVACAAGTFAFSMSCVAAWIRKKVE